MGREKCPPCVAMTFLTELSINTGIQPPHRKEWSAKTRPEASSNATSEHFVSSFKYRSLASLFFGALALFPGLPTLVILGVYSFSLINTLLAWLCWYILRCLPVMMQVLLHSPATPSNGFLFWAVVSTISHVSWLEVRKLVCSCTLTNQVHEAASSEHLLSHLVNVEAYHSGFSYWMFSQRRSVRNEIVIQNTYS